ncbi:MAG TPA: LPS export ABC transporter periplasmic protein LptC [Flavobacteriales bacterium]|nr:LPS export ABC transporter periplasmic protein LptC [Flavobacteriales bacterium]
MKSLMVDEKFPAEVLSDAVVLYSDSAILKARLTAPKMEHYLEKEPYVELTEGINLVFYSEDGEITSHLTANYAINYERQDRMEAKGDVVFINEVGEKLNTEHLIWNQKEERIYSEEFVKITTADEIIWGEGFESNQSFTNFKIKHIKGTILVED